MEVELKYKTRGNVTPLHRSKIYIACHKDDYQFLDEICVDILNFNNCAIYYLDNNINEIDEKDLKLKLSQMQVFVFPITSKFFNEDCRAFNLEYKYAMENHIPIIPILVEDTAKRKFSEKCGSLQILTKYSKDGGLIQNYLTELQTFLYKNLIEETFGKNILNSYVANLFLSYRRKDREQAIKLMKTIHEDKTLEDVGIWYDEFLTPGENYNNEIDVHLKEADAFILLVTPNTVEENNYIIRIEYPNAKKLNKTIIPIEVEKTDKNLLTKSFDDLPKVLNINNKDEIFNFIKEKVPFKNRDLGEKIDNKFKIAFGYINGIGVEKNPQKGVNILEEMYETKCANILGNGYTAVHTGVLDHLAKIYYNGKYVEKNVEKSIQIQREYYEYEKESFRKGKTNSLEPIIIQGSDLFVKYVNLNKIDEAEKLAIEICDNFTDAVLKQLPKVLVKLIEIYLGLIDILNKTNKKEKHSFYMKKYEELLAIEKNNSGTVQDAYMQEKRYNLLKAAEALRADDNLNGYNYSMKALEYANKLMEIDSFKYGSDKIGVCCFLVESCKRLGKMVEANSYIPVALDICNKIRNFIGEDEYNYQLAEICYVTAALAFEKKEYKSAQITFKTAISSYKKVQSSYHQEAIDNRIIEVENFLTKIENFLKQQEQVNNEKQNNEKTVKENNNKKNINENNDIKESLEKVEQIKENLKSEKIANSCSNSNNEQNLFASICSSLSFTLYSLSELKKEIKFLNKTSPKENYLKLAILYKQLADHYFNLQKYKKSKKYYLLSCEHFKVIFDNALKQKVKNLNEEPYAILNFYNAKEKLAYIFSKRKKDYNKAIDLYYELLKIYSFDKNYDYIDKNIKFVFSLTKLHKKLKNYDEIIKINKSILEPLITYNKNIYNLQKNKMICIKNVMKASKKLKKTNLYEEMKQLKKTIKK